MIRDLSGPLATWSAVGARAAAFDDSRNQGSFRNIGPDDEPRPRASKAHASRAFKSRRTLTDLLAVRPIRGVLVVLLLLAAVIAPTVWLGGAAPAHVSSASSEGVRYCAAVEDTHGHWSHYFFRPSDAIQAGSSSYLLIATKPGPCPPGSVP